MGLETTIIDIILSLFGVLPYESGPNYTFGRGNSPKVDEKATREYFQSPEQHGKRDQSIKKLEFQTLLLRYMMNEDDGKISLNEKNIIIKNFDHYKYYLKREDIKRIKSLLKEEYSLEAIVKFAQLKDLTERDINEGIGLLEIINQQDKRYSGIVDKVKRRFVSVKEYM